MHIHLCCFDFICLILTQTVSTSLVSGQKCHFLFFILLRLCAIKAKSACRKCLIKSNTNKRQLWQLNLSSYFSYLYFSFHSQRSYRTDRAVSITRRARAESPCPSGAPRPPASGSADGGQIPARTQPVLTLSCDELKMYHLYLSKNCVICNINMYIKFCFAS